MGLAIGNALPVVIIQRDFLAGGSLTVCEGRGFVPVLDPYFGLAERKALAVLASRDRHPPKQPASNCACWNTRFMQPTSKWATALAPRIKFVMLERAASPATR